MLRTVLSYLGAAVIGLVVAFLAYYLTHFVIIGLVFTNAMLFGGIFLLPWVIQATVILGAILATSVAMWIGIQLFEGYFVLPCVSFSLPTRQAVAVAQ